MKWLCKLGMHAWRLKVGMSLGGGVVEQTYRCKRCGDRKNIRAVDGHVTVLSHERRALK